MADLVLIEAGLNELSTSEADWKTYIFLQYGEHFNLYCAMEAEKQSKIKRSISLNLIYSSLFSKVSTN
jgi:hypothetical protein